MHSEFIQVHPGILGCKHWRAAVRLCHWILKSDTCAVEQSSSDIARSGYELSPNKAGETTRTHNAICHVEAILEKLTGCLKF